MDKAYRLITEIAIEIGCAAIVDIGIESDRLIVALAREILGKMHQLLGNAAPLQLRLYHQSMDDTDSLMLILPGNRLILRLLLLIDHDHAVEHVVISTDKERLRLNILLKGID